MHKFVRGYVDLQLNGMGDRLNEVRAFFEPHLSEEMSVALEGKSAAIRTHVPVLNSADNFD